MENVNQKENDLKEYQISGNLIRDKNKTLNNIYAKSKDLDRKEEFNKGTSKFIFRIKTNNTQWFCYLRILHLLCISFYFS